MKLTELAFNAQEFREDERFHLTHYKYLGHELSGWKIYREGELFEELGPGYVLLNTYYCGICSTDIVRAKLPFKLPQISGHEIIAEYEGKYYAVEINASHKSRGVEHAECFYCNNGMDIHCNDRVTLGIDRLPGGFSPHILAPRHSLTPLPENLSTLCASITEPFAAAYHAVATAVKKNHSSVAVVGPRRLGTLVLLSLALHRNKMEADYSITAITRNSALFDICQQAGADEVLQVSDISNQKYDVVFDTTGSESGFLLSLKLAKKILHVKSTNGKPVAGLKNLTEMVINELSLHTVSESEKKHLCNSIADERVKEIIIDESVSQSFINHLGKIFADKKFTVARIDDSLNSSKQYDLAIVSTICQINRVVKNHRGCSSVRAMAKLYLYDSQHSEGELAAALRRGLHIETSRCGNFKQALEIMSSNASQFENFCDVFISQVRGIGELNTAFEDAKNDRGKIKIVMKHWSGYTNYQRVRRV